MSKNGLSIYQMSRNAAKLSREEAAELLHISPRQLARYESMDSNEFTKPEDEIVAIMMEVYNDLYLGYQHMMQSPVARKLIPPHISPLPMLNTITRLGHKCSHFTSHVFALQEAALDNRIDAHEMHLWENAQTDADDIIGAALGMKLIQLEGDD